MESAQPEASCLAIGRDLGYNVWQRFLQTKPAFAIGITDFPQILSQKKGCLPLQKTKPTKKP